MLEVVVVRTRRMAEVIRTAGLFGGRLKRRRMVKVVERRVVVVVVVVIVVMRVVVVGAFNGFGGKKERSKMR